MDWWWIGRDIPIVVKKSRANHRKLTGPSFRILIVARDSLLSDTFPVGYRGDYNVLISRHP